MHKASARSGDAQARGVARFLLERAAVPYIRMLEKWIFYGELEDPHKEFMVCVCVCVAVWLCGYVTAASRARTAKVVARNSTSGSSAKSSSRGALSSSSKAAGLEDSGQLQDFFQSLLNKPHRKVRCWLRCIVWWGSVC